MTDAAKWIRHPLDSDENRLVPVFRRRFAVKPGLAEATLRITAHGVYEQVYPRFDQLLPPDSGAGL